MTMQLEINAPVNKVFDLFIDKSKFPDWKIGFVSYEQVSGAPGEVGAVARLNYKRYAMIETVRRKDKPNLYIAAYEYLQNGKTMMEHEAVNTFTAISDNKTLVEVTSEIKKVNGFFNKLFVSLMAKAGEKQFRDQLKLFKELAEK